MRVLWFVALFGCGYEKLPPLASGDGGVDAAISCSEGAVCPTGVCDTSTNVCVECIDDSTCDLAKPICSNDVCVGCMTNADCSSNTCLPSGQCAQKTDVAYVAPTGSGTDCSLMMPCGSVTDGLATMRPFIHLSGMFSQQAIATSSTTVTIIGDRDATGAITSILLPQSGSPLLSIGGAGPRVTLVDISLVGTGGSSVGISMFPTAGSGGVLSLSRCSVSGFTSYGIQSSAADLNIDRSMIRDNRLGGVSVFRGTLHLTNSLVVANSGAGANAIGGVLVDEASVTIDFSTIAGNITSGSGAKGVACQSATACVISSSIVANNSGAMQISGAAVTYSAVYPDAYLGTGNLNVDPTFVDSGNGNFHVQATSSVIDRADPASTITVDYDGDVRPQGGGRDIGADEAH